MNELGTLLLGLNDANAVLIERIKKAFADTDGSLTLAGDEPSLVQVVEDRKRELRLAMNLVNDSSKLFDQARTALLKDGDERLARELYGEAHKAHQDATDVLEQRVPAAPAPAPWPKPRTTDEPPAQPRPSAPKADEPKPAPADDDTPAWAQKLGATLTGHIESCKQELGEIRKGTLPPEIRDVLAKRDPAALEAALAVGEKTEERLSALEQSGLRPEIVKVLNNHDAEKLAAILLHAEKLTGYEPEWLATMLRLLAHKTESKDKRDRLLARFWNLQDADEQQPDSSTPTAPPAPGNTH